MSLGEKKKDPFFRKDSEGVGRGEGRGSRWEVRVPERLIRNTKSPAVVRSLRHDRRRRRLLRDP